MQDWLKTWTPRKLAEGVEFTSPENPNGVRLFWDTEDRRFVMMGPNDIPIRLSITSREELNEVLRILQIPLPDILMPGDKVRWTKHNVSFVYTVLAATDKYVWVEGGGNDTPLTIDRAYITEIIRHAEA